MATKFKTYRDESRRNYGATREESVGLCVEQLSLGCQMRIADAVEKMAGSYKVIIDERDYYKRRYENRSESIKTLGHQIAGLRGAIKRMKKAKKA